MPEPASEHGVGVSLRFDTEFVRFPKRGESTHFGGDAGRIVGE